MKRLLLIMFALFAANALRAAPVEHWFEQANRAYADGMFDSAAALYEQIIESGFENSTVLYNYGNALYRLKKTGPARLAFERAALFDPDDPDITANIRFVQSNIVDRTPEPERGFLDMALWKLHILLPLRMQLWLAFAIWAALALCVGFAMFAPRNLRLWLIYISVLFGLFLTALGGSIGFKIYTTEKVAYAVVLSPAIDAKNEPEGATVLFTAHEGTKFRIRKIVGEWALVSLPNGVSGWVEMKAIGSI